MGESMRCGGEHGIPVGRKRRIMLKIRQEMRDGSTCLAASRIVSWFVNYHC